MKAEARTVVVISHDDRFFGAADRVVRIQNVGVASDTASLVSIKDGAIEHGSPIIGCGHATEKNKMSWAEKLVFSQQNKRGMGSRLHFSNCLLGGRLQRVFLSSNCAESAACAGEKRILSTIDLILSAVSSTWD
ncbi:hypothetical protein JNB88_07505 [Rhizobium cauense]|uniref:hypothetical protein n=1 Tax=Rhizobium cauense TaxID=1166683 RepID=UPI001C6E178A|nr:hypothetical protein [Rhizobium cauense]MBW9113489.1 hypothetical protein [Rhizobium cauense]